MTPFYQTKLNLPPVKQFIKEHMEQFKCSRAEAKEQYNLLKEDEIWCNDLYQVNIHRKTKHGFGDEMNIVHLSIKRLDKEAIHDWRHLQIIKTELVGAEVEAIEIYPKESRLVDTVNQYHLWCFTDGYTIPVGFWGRAVDGVAYGNTKQRPFDD